MYYFFVTGCKIPPLESTSAASQPLLLWLCWIFLLEAQCVLWVRKWVPSQFFYKPHDLKFMGQSPTPCKTFIHVSLCWQVTLFLPCLNIWWSSPTWPSTLRLCGTLRARRLRLFPRQITKTSDQSPVGWMLGIQLLSHLITATAQLKKRRMGRKTCSTYLHDSTLLLMLVRTHE